MTNTTYTIVVPDAPDASGHFHACALNYPGIAATSCSRDRAAVGALLALLEAFPPPQQQAGEANHG